MWLPASIKVTSCTEICMSFRNQVDSFMFKLFFFVNIHGGLQNDLMLSWLVSNKHICWRFSLYSFNKIKKLLLSFSSNSRAGVQSLKNDARVAWRAVAEPIPLFFCFSFWRKKKKAFFFFFFGSSFTICFGIALSCFSAIIDQLWRVLYRNVTRTVRERSRCCRHDHVECFRMYPKTFPTGVEFVSSLEAPKDIMNPIFDAIHIVTT